MILQSKKKPLFDRRADNRSKRIKKRVFEEGTMAG